MYICRSQYDTLIEMIIISGGSGVFIFWGPLGWRHFHLGDTTNTFALNLQTIINIASQSEVL